MCAIVSHTRRTLMIALTLAVLFITGANQASADTSLVENGLTGMHWLRDTSVLIRGAECFKTGQLLTHMAVRPPVMYAINKTHGVDSQRVAWRVLLVRADTGAVVKVAPYQSVTASDIVPAAFSAYTFTGLSVLPKTRYFARVEMVWLTPSNAIEGASVHRVDFYGIYVDNVYTGTQSACSAA